MNANCNPIIPLYSIYNTISNEIFPWHMFHGYVNVYQRIIFFTQRIGFCEMPGFCMHAAPVYIAEIAPAKVRGTFVSARCRLRQRPRRVGHGNMRKTHRKMRIFQHTWGFRELKMMISILKHGTFSFKNPLFRPEKDMERWTGWTRRFQLRPAGCGWVSVGFSGFLYRWISLATIFNNSQLVVNSDG